ncbi:MAG TPA: carboxymuconolactone decarboxylase family protein [Gemmatimonadaceae bacterium]|nr:carboxymuconolactone decarboxylase family protein [Gemmatimonadaceae bacterium]
MTPQPPIRATLHELDAPTRALVRLSAIVTAGTEADIRAIMQTIPDVIPAAWVEELLLQSHLFAGFPRALNAMREWRRVQPDIAVAAPANDASGSSAADLATWRADGEATCAAVYGGMYDRLRHNIRLLHPLLDDWMITDGYGKVLSRPGLDLARRELCIVAACAAAGQDRQLHSHLHGARNVGVEPDVVDDVIEAVADDIGADRAQAARLLWARVRGK